MVDLTYELSGIDSLERRFGPTVVQRALRASINKAASKGRTQVSKEVRQRYKIGAAEFNRRLKSTRATARNGHYELLYKGRRAGLINFGAREVRGIGQVANRGANGRFTGGFSEASRFAQTDHRRSGSRSRERADTRRTRAQVGISVEVRRGQRKTIQALGDILPFIGTGRNGADHIFRRSGRHSLPIERLETLSVPQMVEQIDGFAVVDEVLGREHGIEFDRAMRHFGERGR